MPPGNAALLVTTSFLMLLSSSYEARGQQAKPDEAIIASYPLSNSINLSTMRVTKIDAGAGTAILTPPEEQGFFGNSPRGETLLLLQDEKTFKISHVVRANIDEILEKGEVVVKLGKEAAKVMRTGPVLQVYPFDGLVDLHKIVYAPVPSRKFRELPEVISISDDGARKEGMSAAERVTYHAKSTNNLKQIILALHSFESANGFFPPAVIYGPDGRPWHSWRTLILPYLQQVDLYIKYDFSQPWDAPDNKAVVETVVDVFKDPIYGNSNEAVTHYGVIVGRDAAFLPDGAEVADKKKPLANMAKGARKIVDFTDGTSNSIMVAPLAGERKVPWAKPEDIRFDQIFPASGKSGGLSMPYELYDGKVHTGPVAFADGTVRPLTSDMDRKLLQSLITPNGGEIIDIIDIPIPGSPIYIPLLKLIRKPDGSYTARID